VRARRQRLVSRATACLAVLRGSAVGRWTARTAVLLTVLPGLAGCSMLPGRALTPQKIFERTAPSVVRIDSVMTEGDAIGTGFVVSDRLIATNLHVIDGASKVSIQFPNGTRALVRRVVAFDEGQDLAILETAARGLRPLTLADSDGLAEGERIYAIGNPLGLDYTITDGLFSGRRRITEDEPVDLLQVSVLLSPGSSGGPLLNERGQVVGVATRTFAQQRYGLGIPSNSVSQLVELSGEGLAFDQFAERRRGAKRPPASAAGSARRREIPVHPIELISSCSEDDIRIVAVSILEAIDRGAPAYNAGSPEDCYRIYEGAALRIVRDLGERCGGSRDALEYGLDRARGLESFDDKAWALRDSFDGLLDVVRRRIEGES